MASSHSKQQISEFLKFFSVKRESYVDEIGSIYNDVQESRLLDEMYTKDEIVELLGDLVKTTKACMRRDLEANTNMGALAVEQLLAAAEAPSAEAEAHRNPPVLDMTLTEDEASLARMQLLNQQFQGSANLRLRKSGVVQAETLQEEHNRLEAAVTSITEEAAQLRERCQQEEAARATAEREARHAEARIAALSAQVAALQRGAGASAAMVESHAAEVAAMHGTLAKVRAEADTARGEVVAARKEREAAINTSKPFKLMKAMLGNKNALITQLRASLRKYEPEEGAGAGDLVEDVVPVPVELAGAPGAAVLASA